MLLLLPIPSKLTAAITPLPAVVVEWPRFHNYYSATLIFTHNLS
jgi:hypothetical protein